VDGNQYRGNDGTFCCCKEKLFQNYSVLYLPVPQRYMECGHYFTEIIPEDVPLAPPKPYGIWKLAGETLGTPVYTIPMCQPFAYESIQPMVREG